MQQADLEEADGLLVWVLPADLQGLTLTVIFSNGGSNQVELGWTIGPDQQKIWRADGSANGVWEDYTPG